MGLNVYHFGVPAVGYCTECDKQAIYNSEEGLHCPECKTKDLDIFEQVEASTNN